VATGNITEYPLQAGNGNFGTASVPNDIIAGPDGNMWFADNSQYNPGIGKVAIGSGAVTMYTKGLQRTPQPVDLTIGPDGNIWFTDSPGGVGQDLVGTIDTSTGTIQEYSLSVQGLQLQPIITVGSKLEAISTGGIVGQPPGSFAAEITLPDVSASGHARRTTSTSSLKH
jgi:streptogramin lyase